MGNNLSNISPIDGRYYKITQKLSEYFSEFSFIKTRFMIEIEYFIFLKDILPELNNITNKNIKDLRYLHLNFNLNDVIEIKKIEEKTNHDVKSIEIYLRNKFSELNLNDYKEFIHFGLTSQDINSLSYSINIKKCVNIIFVELIDNLIKKINSLSNDWENILMISRTHGQPATPTTMGKEFKVFLERLINQKKYLYSKFFTKFGGSVGNLSSHFITYPDKNWEKIMDQFVGQFGLYRNQYTTQIDHYDNYSFIFQTIERINTILIDLNQDIWLYISMDYLQQKIKKDEIGSSVMPHKINPIDFENSEGNFLLANNMFSFFSRKLPISRLQRDLTDTTITRNIGVAFGYTIIGINSLLKGLDKIILNREKINQDLEDNYIVFSEVIQTILRKYGHEDAYNIIKKQTRINQKFNKEMMFKMIDNLEIDSKIKKELKNITPQTYLGWLNS